MKQQVTMHRLFKTSQPLAHAQKSSDSSHGPYRFYFLSAAKIFLIFFFKETKSLCLVFDERQDPTVARETVCLKIWNFKKTLGNIDPTWRDGFTVKGNDTRGEHNLLRRTSWEKQVHTSYIRAKIARIVDSFAFLIFSTKFCVPLKRCRHSLTQATSGTDDVEVKIKS